MEESTFKKAFEVLQDREAFFKNVSQQNYSGRIVGAQIIIIAVLCFAYVLVMGSYYSFSQASLTGIKIWLLIFSTLLICFPSFYIVQLILGSKMAIKQLIILLLSGLVVVTTVMVAFAPIVLFFQLSAANYQFLQLLHVFVFIFSGFYGMKIVLEALKRVFESNQVYPKIGLTVFKIWVVIFAFVGMQLSWNLRPFIGSKNLPFELFRTSTQGNFYTTVFGAIGDLLDGDDQQESQKEETNSNEKPEKTQDTQTETEEEATIPSQDSIKNSED